MGGIELAIAAIGLSVLVVGLRRGPGAWVRERGLRPALVRASWACRRRGWLPRPHRVLGCLVCSVPWSGLVVWLASLGHGGTTGLLVATLAPAGLFWMVPGSSAGLRGGGRKGGGCSACSAKGGRGGQQAAAMEGSVAASTGR